MWYNYISEVLRLSSKDNIPKAVEPLSKKGFALTVWKQIPM